MAGQDQHKTPHTTMTHKIPVGAVPKKGHMPGPELHGSTSANGHESKGLPQLNVHDFAPQLVWLAISFGLLYWIMSRLILPRIAGTIEARHRRIADDIDAAKEFQRKAEQAEAAYKTDLAKAKDKARKIAQATKDRLERETERKREEVDQQIAAQMIEAEQRINAAKNMALKEVNMVATSTTGEIIQHLVGQEIAPKDLLAAIASVNKP